MTRRPLWRRYRAAARSPRSPSQRFQKVRTSDRIAGRVRPRSVRPEVALDLPRLGAPRPRSAVVPEERARIRVAGIAPDDLPRLQVVLRRVARHLAHLVIVVLGAEPRVMRLAAH